ncbi:MAG: hypothetical protein IPJ81_05605 [Chitinophagaceae bacterium]|nr:hypothetical protein [Chitinophagaceae bacterium]
MPAPNLSVITSNILTPNQWIITSYLGDEGFRYYTITNQAGGYASPLVANTEFEVMKLAFTGGPALATDVELITKGNAGDVFGEDVPCPGCGNVLFLYSSLSAGSENIASQIYYHRPNTTEFTMDSYNSPNVADESWARITGITLSVKFLGLTATQK